MKVLSLRSLRSERISFERGKEVVGLQCVSLLFDESLLFLIGLLLLNVFQMVFEVLKRLSGKSLLPVDCVSCSIEDFLN